MCTQRPPTIVATTCTSGSSSGSIASGSRSRTTRSASRPGSSRPRRRSSPERQVGVTQVAWSGLLDRQRLLGPPGRPLVDRAQDTGGDPGDRVELLDRRVRAVGDERAGVEQRAERVRALESLRPEPVGEVAVGGGVRELHRARDPELREARDVLGREALGVLDPMPQPLRLPRLAGRLERVERIPVRPVADRVHADGPAALGAAADDLLELLAARDLDARAVESSAPSASRACRP